MNTKKIIITLASIGLAASFALTAFAQTNPSATPSSTPVQTMQTRKDCVASAKSVENASMKQAKDGLKTAKASALQTKNAALASAKTLTDKTAKKDAIKAANDAYKASVKTANDAYSVASKAAKSQYKVDVAACPAK